MVLSNIRLLINALRFLSLIALENAACARRQIDMLLKYKYSAFTVSEQCRSPRWLPGEDIKRDAFDFFRYSSFALNATYP